MKVIIFNDVQNFNGSLDILNSRYGKTNKKFWDYNKYIPFLIRKINFLDKLKKEKLLLDKAFFYTGRYNSKLIEHLKWSCHKKIGEINRLIEKEKWLLDFVSQQKLSYELRIKVNHHIEDIKKELEEKRKAYFSYILKQERNFEGQRKLFEEIKKDKIIEIKSLPLKQKDGEVYQKGVDVLIATDLINLAHTNHYDLAIVLSGDTDLIEAIRLIRKMGKKVIIVSYHTPRNPEMSNISDLMTAGNHFLNLRNLNDEEVEKMSDLREDKSNSE